MSAMGTIGTHRSQSELSSRNLTSGNVGIATTAPTETLSVNGNVSIEGTNCRDSGGAATCNNFVDIAELFPSSEPVESGDIVVIDFQDNPNSQSENPLMPQARQNPPEIPKTTLNPFQNTRPEEFQNQAPENSIENSENNPKGSSAFKVKKSRQPYDSKVIGVVSTQPAIVIEGGRIVAMGGWNGQSNTMKPAIALAGRVPVKATAENGPIQKGDLLTASSKAGYAMKCELMQPNGKNTLEELNKIIYSNELCRNSILGKALESCNKEECKILALVTLQ